MKSTISAVSIPLIFYGLYVFPYGILQFLWLRSFANLGKKGIEAVVICLGITIAYGIFNGICQAFVPGSYGSLFNILLKVIGAFAGAELFLIYQQEYLNLQKT